MLQHEDIILTDSGCVLPFKQGSVVCFNNIQKRTLPGGIEHIKGLLPNTDFLKLKREIHWEPFYYGKKRMNRDVCRIDPYELSYGEHPYLHDLVTQAISKIPYTKGKMVDGVFCNIYADGSNHTPYHQDSYECDVLTLSFGGSRDFLTKPVEGGKSTKYTCEDGDAVVFTQEWNSQHKHSVPKRAKATERISVVIFLR